MFGPRAYMFSGGAPTTPAPTIAFVQPTYIAYSGGGLQPTAGGTSFSVFGANFAIGATVGFYQAGILIALAVGTTTLASTWIICDTPALPSGVYDVRVTNPDSQFVDAVGVHRSWEPGDETWGALFLPGNYNDGTGTWTDSSGNGLDATAAVGTPVADAGCPIIDPGTSAYLSIPESIADGVTPMATLLEGTIFCIYEAAASDAELPDYSNPALVSGSGASPGLYHAAKGFKVATYDPLATVYIFARVAKARCGVPQAAFNRWNGATYEGKLNAGPWVGVTNTAATLSSGNVGATTYIGSSYSSVFKGKIKMVGIYPTAMTNLLAERLHVWAALAGHVPFSTTVTLESFAGVRHWRDHRSIGDDGLGNVISWNDLSASGRHLGQGDASKQPALTLASTDYYDENVVTFDPSVTSRKLDSAVLGANGAQPSRRFFIGQYGSTTGYLLDQTGDGNTADPNARQAYLTTAGEIYLFAGSAAISAAAQPTTPAVICVEWNGVSTNVYVNDATTPVVAAIDPGAQEYNSIRLGDRYDETDPFTGVLVAEGDFDYDAVDATRKTLMYEMAARYGIPVIG
jgi:hypothetical protein